MSRIKLLQLFSLLSAYTFAQNDMDAIRYSRPGVNGTSRFAAMGGAFGAIGADASTAAYNPAGLGVYRKGEISFSGGLRLSNNTANIYDGSATTSNVKFAFNNFGLTFAWKANNDEESRNVFSFSNTQLQNFNSSTRMSGYTNNSSIAKDMLTLANEAGSVDYLNKSYEGLGYYSYLLDRNFAGDQFVSLVDTKRSVFQTRDLITSGRMNELNISYAYSYKDKYYFGASIGIPRIEYTSTMTHSESDGRDSMQVNLDSTGYPLSSTYIDGFPDTWTNYSNMGGFNSLSYSEYFRTTGSGVNLKLGGIVRINDALRLGGYIHTPSMLFLTDTYSNTISTSFDYNRNFQYIESYPEEGGRFNYRVITPARLSINAAYLVKKIAVIGVDYEFINYRSAKLVSDNIGDFDYANSAIKSKYKAGHVVRVGGELNIKPVMIRAGYVMQGSSFGDTFSGAFVRHTFSAGLGFRGKGPFFFDLVWARMLTSEDYFLFTTLNTKAKLNMSATSLAATLGVKF